MQRQSRQTFLGETFIKSIESNFVSIIGLGGGGSFIATELAHIGQKNYFICDPDNFEESNINRTLGSIDSDIKLNVAKTEIACRSILNILPQANIIARKDKWQNCLDVEEFKNSKIIFSCLDDFSNRMQLEAFARASHIPLIDIGLTIKKTALSYQMMGQVVLSHPAGPCFRCYNFITEKDLESEAQAYGDAGKKPQVIWANGILASCAVGLGIDLISGWSLNTQNAFYKHLDGNKLNLFDNLNLSEGVFTNSYNCPHFDKCTLSYNK